MPWRETCHMDERTQFIARLLTGEDEMAGLCREYGISRKTGYKWLGRYRCEGAAGLADRSHAPLRHGQARDVSVVQAVLDLRERWPHWGPKKLRVKLGELASGADGSSGEHDRGLAASRGIGRPRRGDGGVAQPTRSLLPR